MFAALALFFHLDAIGGTEPQVSRQGRPGRILLDVAWATFIVYCAVVLSSDLMGMTSFGFQLLGLVFAGVSEALGIYLYAVAMVSLPMGPLLMLLGFASTNAVNALLATVTETASTYLLIAFRAVSLFVAAIAMARLSEGRCITQEGRPGESPASDTMAERLPMPGRGQRAALVVACLLVNAVSGFYVSIPSAGGTALDGAEKSIMGTLLFLVDVAAFGVFVLRPGLSQRPACLYAPLALCLLGLLFMPLYAQPAGTLVGIVMVRVGRDLFEVLSWVYAMYILMNHPAKGRPLLCLVLAVSSFYFGAPFAKLLEGPIAASELFFSEVNVAVSLVLATCLPLVGSLRRTGDDPTRPLGYVGYSFEKQERGTLTSRHHANDDLVGQLAGYDARIADFIGALKLDERETSVLVDTLHGFTGEAVGERLGYSRDAVKSTLARIYAKAGVSSKQELAEAIESWELQS